MDKEMDNENQDDFDEEQEEPGTMKQWLQDNLRIIISIVIVVAIAGGIYSYSKRIATPTDELSSQSSITDELEKNLDEEEEIMEDGEITATTPKTSTEGSSTSTSTTQITSQETEDSFIETAARGDGTTHLARRALANYLEKNPDSVLTPEHKIYIEDYLRKNVPQKSVHIGASVEFSKSLIQDAIVKSKNLTENQLQNLHKYAVLVPSLT